MTDAVRRKQGRPSGLPRGLGYSLLDRLGDLPRRFLEFRGDLGFHLFGVDG